MGATKQNAKLHSFTSTADQRLNQYCLQKLDTSNEKSVVIAGAGEEVIGSLENKPNAGEEAAVAVRGEILVIAGAQVTVGQEIMSDAYGHGVPKSGASYTIGQATSAASAGPNSNTGEFELISVLVNPKYFAA